MPNEDSKRDMALGQPEQTILGDSFTRLLVCPAAVRSVISIHRAHKLITVASPVSELLPFRLVPNQMGWRAGDIRLLLF
jgi:hypothetical protein